MRHANKSHYFALGDGSARSARLVVRAAKHREKQKRMSDRNGDAE